MRGYGLMRAHLASSTTIGVDGESLPQKMDDLGVQAAVLGRGALEQQRVEVMGQAEGEACLVWHGAIIASP